MIDLLSSCYNLQKSLKDQFLLLSTEQQQKATFEKKLESVLKNYHRNFIHLTSSSFSTSKAKEQVNQRILLENEGFGNSYTFIKQVIFSLAKNPKLCMQIIKKHQNWLKVESFQGVIKSIIGSMYENIVNDEIFEKDLIFLIGDVIELIVKSKEHFYEYNFNENSLPCEILKQFTQKLEFMNYAKQITRSTLLQIAKLQKIIDFNQEEPNVSVLKKIQSKRFDSPVKNRQHLKSSFSVDTSSSKITSYSQALRTKDEKIRVTPNIRTKNKNCVSIELMRFLGISDEISFPSFFCANNQNQIKQEEQINKQWAILLTKKQSSKKQLANIPDIQTVKNLVFTFFGDLFKTLYSMPNPIRIVSKIMYNHLFSKYGTKKASLNVLSNFIIDFWITSTLKFDETLIETGKIGDYSNSNAQLIRKIIKGIIKNDYKEINPTFQSQFNHMMSDLRLSILNYLCELINVEVPIEKQVSQNIMSYSICLSVQDIKRFLQMLQSTRQQVTVLNQKIMKRVDRIYEMSEDEDIFGEKKDMPTNKTYKSHQAYVLFNELSLPKQLSFDYLKYYNDAFKKQKIKNLLKQVLLNISDINTIDVPLSVKSLKDFFEQILKSDSQKLQLNSIDRVPVNLKIRYFLSLTKSMQEKQIRQLIDTMEQQTKQRLKHFNETWDKTKQCYLKAIANVLSQNQKISYNQINYIDQSRKKKLQQFINKVKINVCLTSPKTREKEVVLRSNIMKDISEEEKQKIWLDNQNRCVHTALNLEFIKSLTGQAEKVKTKYESHINTIMKFPQFLASLPEIKECGLNENDKYGLKQIFQQFIRYCIELIRKKQTDYKMLLENESWFQENLQQKLSKKIYDKMYPKMPTYDDLGIYFRLKTLDWITYEHLKIPLAMRIDGMWDIAAKKIKSMEKMKTAGEKLNCIVEACKLINQCYSVICSNDSPVTADDIYPIVIYVLIKAAPRRLVSNINFIQLYANQGKLISNDGYCFTQLKSAVQYCSQLNFESLESDLGMVEFNKKIYEKQIQYGIYFLLGRKKDSPRTTFRKIEYLKEHYFPKTKQKN